MPVLIVNVAASIVVILAANVRMWLRERARKRERDHPAADRMGSAAG
jgi:hypothetical protein